MRIAIVTDSTADIPPEEIADLPILVVPTILVIDGEQYEDGADISRQDFYDQLPAMRKPPTTAAPSSGAFSLAYDRFFQSGFDYIYSIHTAASLSAICSAARIAARDFSGKVEVADSGQTSMGLGFQVLAAARAAARGGDIDTVGKEFHRVRSRVRLAAMLDTLSYLQRSGRVSWMKANVGSLLKIKTFIAVQDGEVRRTGQVRTRRRGMDHLLEEIRSHGPLEQLAILHTNAEHEARVLLSAVELPVSWQPLLINVTPVIGAHVGPAGLGYAVVINNADA